MQRLEDHKDPSGSKVGYRQHSGADSLLAQSAELWLCSKRTKEAGGNIASHFEWTWFIRQVVLYLDQLQPSDILKE